jgi:hypothetical protein
MPFFKTIDEIRKYIPVDINMSIETLLPSIKDAEEMFVKDLLGELYAVLLADYTDNTDAEGADTGMNADNALLLPFVQRALAYYSLYLSIENVAVSIGDGGIQQTYSQNSQPAPRWKIRDLQATYINKADRFADKLLQFLEENAAADTYGTWFSDVDANTAMSGVIVHSTKIASKYIDINDSRRIFLRLKKRIQQIESLYIKGLICGDQYDELVTQLQTGSLTANNRKLLNVLEPVIAKKALYETIPSLRISVTPEGLHLLSVTDSSVIQSSASDNEINKLMKSLKDGEFGYLADEETAKKFINDNIADYALIADSPCYSATPIARNYTVDNDPCNKHFSV